MLQKLKTLAFGLIMLTPLLARAAAGPIGVVGGSGSGTSLDRFMDLLLRTFNTVIPIMVALALIYFIYGLAEYILESGEESKKVEGRTRMIYGTIAMFVIASVWGLVFFLQDLLNINKNDTQGRAPSVSYALSDRA